MLLSLQRRQQQEETKARKEIDAMQRREREREKEDERIRKREEQAARRAAILEQHKLKKAIEEAEQKGITLDRNDLMALKQQHSLLASGSSSGGGASGGPKLRAQKVVRPRPKTIHVETGSVDLSEASSLSSRNKKGSNSNLTGKQSNGTHINALVEICLCEIWFGFCYFFVYCFDFIFRYFLFTLFSQGIGQLSSNSIRRDYYRGSQDSLAIRGERHIFLAHDKHKVPTRLKCSA